MMSLTLRIRWSILVIANPLSFETTLLITGKYETKTYASIMRVLIDAVTPGDGAMEVPVVVASAAKPSLVTGPEKGFTITRYGVEVVGTNVFAPFPQVT